MNDVKTYLQVNREDEGLSFGIARTEHIFEKLGGMPDEPHRHDYFTVVISEKARGKHFIDFNEYTLADSQIFFIAPGQVHQIIEEKKPSGYAIVFSNQFLVENNIPIWFIEDLNLFHDFGESPPLQLNNLELNKILGYASEMYGLHQSDVTFKSEAIGALLKLILIQCNNVCSLPKAIELQSLDNRSSVLSQFKSLINEHYKEWHSIKEYASELHISPDYLNRIVKSQTGKTAKEHIQSRITVAAKRLLYFTDLSNKEIGYELGFSEQANFSAFFKNCVGISPSQFKTSA